MDLSSELLSKFAKITNDTDKKKERTVYGTIAVSDGAKYVKLDGSNILTPMLTTVKIAEGDRVTVMIKNHTAVVTGNLTSPAAKDSDLSIIETDGKKEATNYLEKLSDGSIILGDLTVAQLLYNITIGSSGISLRKGSNTIAKLSDTENIVGNKTATFDIQASELIHTIKDITYRPYYTVGDSISMTWNGVGFVTGSLARFCIPLSKPVIGVTSVTVTPTSVMNLYINNTVRDITSPIYTAKTNGDFLDMRTSVESIFNISIGTICGITAPITVTFS